MNSTSGQDDRQKTRSKILIVTGYVLLVFMALTWSLGNAFIYLFLGAGLFFIFLGIRNYPKETIVYARPDKKTAYASPGIFENLASLFYRFRQGRQQFSSVTGKKKPVGAIVAGSVIFFFIVMTILIIESAGEGDFSSEMNAAQGSSFFSQGNYDSATIYYRRAMKADASNEESLTGLGNIKIQLQDYDSAISFFEKAIALDPDAAAALYGKSFAYYYQKKYSESLGSLQLILNSEPEHMDALLLSGDCYYMQNDFNAAIGYYEKAYELGARSLELCNIMAYIYDVDKKYDQAIPLYKEALQYDDSNADIKKRLSELLPGPEGNIYRQ